MKDLRILHNQNQFLANLPIIVVADSISRDSFEQGRQTNLNPSWQRLKQAFLSRVYRPGNTVIDKYHSITYMYDYTTFSLECTEIFPNKPLYIEMEDSGLM